MSVFGSRKTLVSASYVTAKTGKSEQNHLKGEPAVQANSQQSRYCTIMSLLCIVCMINAQENALFKLVRRRKLYCNFLPNGIRHAIVNEVCDHGNINTG